MRADAIDLNIAGTAVRVICQDLDAIPLLREALADHLIDEPAPLGFSLQMPARENGLQVVVDRSGLVLGRVRTTEESLAVLGSHLAAFLPPPPGTVRMILRALLGDDSTASLAAFPLFVDPPVVERRLERAAHRMIDRLVADLRVDGTLELSPTPWPALAGSDGVAGHAAAPPAPVDVTRLLIPQLADEKPSQAAVVASLACVTAPGAPQHDRLELAERLAAGPVVSVPIAKRGAQYEALRP